MKPDQLKQLSALGRRFGLRGELVEAHRIKIGHINETYAATWCDLTGQRRFVHQTLNHQVFENPPALMNNVVAVTGHLRRRLAEEGAGDLDRRCLQVVLADDGRPYYRAEDGRFWRTYRFIDRVRTYEAVKTSDQAYQAGHAFGKFQALLADFPSGELAITIPDFHHTRRRFETFQRALEVDEHNRAAPAAREIEFALKHEPMVDALLDAHRRGELPERVTHNDTKFNNVMLDDDSGEAMCVVDLDTVMPGLVLYDFGDMVRTTTSRTAEDELYLDRVELEMPMFEALTRGYLDATRDFLTSGEKRYLVLAGKLITFTIGLRFLTDYLQGDSYFRIHREHHNLDRCRKQFKLIASIQQKEEAMLRLVDALA